jgi:hypothetical protein
MARCCCAASFVANPAPTSGHFQIYQTTRLPIGKGVNRPHPESQSPEISALNE